jgi:hypothetical protein
VIAALVGMLAAIKVTSQWPFILGAWGVTALILGGYAFSVVRRGKRLSRQVPPEQRRWM